VRVLDRPAQVDPNWDASRPDPHSSSAPYRLYNIGSNHPVDLLRYVDVLEQTLGVHAIRNELPMQPGDVADTFADVDELARDFGYRPRTTIEEGITRFVAWYKDYYHLTDVAHNIK
jgi:UDP-glucuronate 4-epimerase